METASPFTGTRVSEEILINVTPSETRVALVENGVLHEVLTERTRRRGLFGNIYKGRIPRVLPGMQVAFIYIGLERNAFLRASEMVRMLRGDDAADAESLPQIGEMLNVD